jgi:uncharacterized membrane protein required for colicin V production
MLLSVISVFIVLAFGFHWGFYIFPFILFMWSTYESSKSDKPWVANLIKDIFGAFK